MSRQDFDSISDTLSFHTAVNQDFVPLADCDSDYPHLVGLNGTLRGAPSAQRDADSDVQLGLDRRFTSISTLLLHSADTIDPLAWAARQHSPPSVRIPVASQSSSPLSNDIEQVETDSASKFTPGPHKSSSSSNLLAGKSVSATSLLDLNGRPMGDDNCGDIGLGGGQQSEFESLNEFGNDSDNSNNNDTLLVTLEESQLTGLTAGNESAPCVDGGGNLDIHGGQLACRNCWDTEGALISPCLCAGTNGFVHRDCLEAWLRQSGLRSCNVCGGRFPVVTQMKHLREWKILPSCDHRVLLFIGLTLTTLFLIGWLLYGIISTLIRDQNDEIDVTHYTISFVWLGVIIVTWIPLFIGTRKHLVTAWHNWKHQNQVVHVM